MAGLQTAARVWDSLLEEGSKILYRVALALLKLHEPELLCQDNPGDLINCLRHCTQRCHDRDKLMKVRATFFPDAGRECGRDSWQPPSQIMQWVLTGWISMFWAVMANMMAWSAGVQGQTRHPCRNPQSRHHKQMHSLAFAAFDCLEFAFTRSALHAGGI